MPAEFPEFIDPVEDCPWRSPRQILARFGYTPLSPSDLDDRQIVGRLWELLYAAAARRFYFSHTDHLSDREFYILLWEHWLDEPTADIPLEAETNTRISMYDIGISGRTSEEIFLRYYATKKDVDLWLLQSARCDLPPHEDPPYDRDRYLPDAPIPREAFGIELPGEDDLSDCRNQEEPDLLRLAAVDDEIAAAKANADSDVPAFNEPDPVVASQLHSCEPEDWVPPLQQLAQERVPLLPPDEVTDETLTALLWELLHHLAARGFYVLHTDHLSERELYEDLWRYGLREPGILPGRSARAAWFHDLLGSWGDDEVQLWLRYYASDEERGKHLADWPTTAIPPKERPLFNRDWRLPKGPF